MTHVSYVLFRFVLRSNVIYVSMMELIKVADEYSRSEPAFNPNGAGFLDVA